MLYKIHNNNERTERTEIKNKGGSNICIRKLFPI